MTVKLYAFTCGTVTGEFAHLMEGGEGDITVPIPVFLIEHPRGRALFATGLARYGGRGLVQSSGIPRSPRKILSERPGQGSRSDRVRRRRRH